MPFMQNIAHTLDALKQRNRKNMTVWGSVACHPSVEQLAVITPCLSYILRALLTGKQLSVGFTRNSLLEFAGQVQGIRQLC